MLMNNKDTISLAGEWTVELEDGKRYPVRLPGTLDENGVGGPDEVKIETRLTRLHVYTGAACYQREVMLTAADDERLFLYVERSRELTLMIDGKPVPARSGSLSTPYTFEVTRWADGKLHAVTLICDNSYPCGARDEIIYSSAATDETQTNWNGLLGSVMLVRQPNVFVDQLRVLPIDADRVRICATIDAGSRCETTVTVQSEALTASVEQTVKLPSGRSDVLIDACVKPDAVRWDELDGRLYMFTAALSTGGSWCMENGLRCFAANEQGRLTINGRVFFLRGEANCAMYPKQGHEPMTVEEWTQVLGTYAAYGVNCMRFHSHCPPDAAFTAADKMGMMMQPELSHWDPMHAFESQESYRVYQRELSEIVYALGHHPSFVMLSLGNELTADDQGVARMHALLDEARRIDPTRLYAWGSNNFYGERGADNHSDFYTSMAAWQEHMRCTSPNMVGQLNEKAPSTDYTFEAGVSLIRKTYSGPIFGFEVGQYEVLPDFDEINDFHGVTRAVNYEIIRERVRARGIDETAWKRQVEATGEMSLACYREEVEAVLRTQSMSGLSLLGIQDFPGQGTALVGMLNANLKAKPYPFADPERFNAFFRPVLPLAAMQKRCYNNKNRPMVGLQLANYGKEAIEAPFCWCVTDGQRTVNGTTEKVLCPVGQLTAGPVIELPLDLWTKAAELTLHVEIGGYSNEYSLWVYPSVDEKQPDNVYVTRDAQEALQLLAKGKRVLLEPDADAASIPASIQSQYTPDFWSVGTFPKQSGAMGCLIEADHPLFQHFPTRSYTTWQWWQMTNGRAIMVPERLHPMVKVLDCYKYLRSLALLLEVRVGKGILMLSGMGLHQHLEHIEVRTLYQAMLDYLASDACSPKEQMSAEELAVIFQQNA